MRPSLIVIALALAGCAQDHNLGETVSGSEGSGGGEETGSEGSSTTEPDSGTSGTSGPSTTTTAPDDDGSSDSSGSGETGDADACVPTDQMLKLGWTAPFEGLPIDEIAVLRGTCTVGAIGASVMPGPGDALHATWIELDCQLEGEIDAQPVAAQTPYTVTLGLRASQDLDLSVITGTVGFRYAAIWDGFEGIYWDQWVQLTPMDEIGADYILDAMEAEDLDPADNNQLQPLLEAHGFGAWRENLTYGFESATCVASDSECVDEEYRVRGELPSSSGSPLVDIGRWELLQWSDSGPASRLYNDRATLPTGECNGGRWLTFRLATLLEGPG